MSEMPTGSPWLPDKAELRSRATFRMVAWGLIALMFLLGGLNHLVRDAAVPAWSSGALLAGFFAWLAWLDRRRTGR
eukprot:gene60571-biopygen43870